MQKIYHKRNELLEVEFFKDKECTKAFESMSHLYYYMHDMDVEAILKAVQELDAIFIIPYISKTQMPILSSGIRIERLENNSNSHFWTLSETERYNERHFQRLLPNLSKYIPEDNAVLFLNDNDFQDYNKYFLGSKFSLIQYPILDKCNLRKSLNFTIFLHYGTQSELQKANEVAKELKEKYGTKKVNVFVLHCFVSDIYNYNSSFLDDFYKQNFQDAYDELCSIECKPNISKKEYKIQFEKDKLNHKQECYINKIITTNSTSILKPQDNEQLQVIDCFDIFNDAL
jgi:hypothetical protein